MQEQILGLLESIVSLVSDCIVEGAIPVKAKNRSNPLQSRITDLQDSIEEIRDMLDDQNQR